MCAERVLATVWRRGRRGAGIGNAESRICPHLNEAFSRPPVPGDQLYGMFDFLLGNRCFEVFFARDFLGPELRGGRKILSMLGRPFANFDRLGIQDGGAEDIRSAELWQQY